MDRSANPRMVPRAGRRITFMTIVMAAALAVLAAGGCSSSAVTLRSVPKSPLIDELNLASWGGPKPSARTVQLLRVYNLSDDLNGDFSALIKKLQAISDREPAADTVYALSELAFLGAKKVEHRDRKAALDLYGASVLHAYDYLFDQRFAATRNQYDPRYRGACDLYNGALESALRIVCETKELVPDTTKTINTASGAWDIQCTLQGSRWQPKDFERFEFVSDYAVNGLKNLYQTHGLGVPLIAVRHSYPDEPVGAKYYPAGLSFPVTAFLRPLSRVDPQSGPLPARNQCCLELYDPLAGDETLVAGRPVPLESDLTTPLAYFLSRPEMNLDSSTVGLLHPEELLHPEKLLKKPADALLGTAGPGPLKGLYMVQPYEPGKIPVLMVHGLWSSPMTWMEMFNDLRSQREIRDHYQFWFYLYPTGQPFWLSAAQMRRDLVRLRETLDPTHQEPALDQMVLIGHSMGGLVSHLQTIQSGDDYWRLACNAPLAQIKADNKAKKKLQETFYFQPSASIRRVVMIGTPHRGSTFSNQTTQWMLAKLITLPQRLVETLQTLYVDNPGAFPDNSLLRIETSIDSLSPKLSIFPAMLAAQRPPWVTYHSIVGVEPKDWWLAKFTAEGDGVVSRESGHFDGAASEITVAANHTTVHSHPAAVLEVRRILLEHLAELQGRPSDAVATRPMSVWPIQPQKR
jgi:pimeloyl-ACP methyl ester carboxylesterase